MLFTIPGHTMMTTIFSSHLSTLSIVCWFGYYYYSFGSSFVFDFDFYIFNESDDAIVFMMIYFLSSGCVSGFVSRTTGQCARPVSLRFSHSFHLGFTSFCLLSLFCFSFIIIIIIIMLLLPNIAYSCWLNTNNGNFDLGLYLHGRLSERLCISNISINYPLNLKKK
jgi:hypothetical protein